MYEAVKKFRKESGKKVVVSMSSVAASGGYYVACAADRIFANPGSITGSIGVIAEWFNYGELLQWAKTESIVIKSGEMKDAGSPTRPLTEAERAYFQSLIDNMYNQFVSAVADGRKMDAGLVRKLADGRVYTGQEAKNIGLVDELGTLQDAVAAAAKLGGITGKPEIVTPPDRNFSVLDLLLGKSRSVLPFSPDRSESHIRFQYLWR
jgi:protease-4